jgi:hypothetical protein
MRAVESSGRPSVCCAGRAPGLMVQSMPSDHGFARFSRGLGLMRKVLFTFLASGLLVVALSSLANGATAARCGTRYTPACTNPHLTVVPLNLQCHGVGSKFSLSNITASSNSGIRKVVIKVGNKTITSKTYKGNGPTQVTIRGVRVSTAGLGVGIHTITVTTTDIRGHKVTRTLRFTICKPVPIFTG